MNFSISPAQTIATQTYARHWRAVNQSVCGPMVRLEASDGLRLARAVLTQQEVAVLDLCAARGRSLGEVAKAAGRTVQAMADLFLGAATKLANHYEALKGSD